MEAKLKKRGEITVISVSGRLEIEMTQGFRETCLKNFTGRKIVFDLDQVNFVGSTGIQPFFETVKALNEKSLHGVKLVSVKPELRKILSHIESEKLEFHENEEVAIQSFDRPKPLVELPPSTTT
jgi:anti-anti-sigma factor